MDSKIRELVQAVRDKTERGGLRWKAFDAEAFRAAIGTGYLHIQRHWAPLREENGDGGSVETYALQVSDGQGRVVAEEEVHEGVRDDGFSLVRDLFRVARIAALGGYKVIDDMLYVLRENS